MNSTRRGFLKGALALAGALAFPKALVDLVRPEPIYHVEYRVRAHNARGWTSWSGTTNANATVTGLKPGTPYDFRVRTKATG